MTDTTTTSTFVRDLKAAQRDASYGRHPFVHAAIDGTLDRRAVGGWAVQQGYLAKEGSQSMAVIGVRVEDWAVKHLYFANFAGEVLGAEGHTNHWELAARLAVACGWSEEEVAAEPPLPETKAILDALMASATWRPWQEAVVLGGICGEEPFGELSPLVSRALRRHYGMSAGEHEYFSDHEEADVEHADTAWAVIDRYAVDDDLRAGLRAVWELGTAIWWNYYDGLHRCYVQGLRPGARARI